MVKKNFLLILLLLPVYVNAQWRLNGRAPGYVGKEIFLVQESDFISGKSIVVAQTKVDSSGCFSWTVNENDIKKYTLVCERARAILYADSGAVYSIQLPLPDERELNNPVQNISLLFDSLPVMDINNLILDFDSRAEEFIYYNFNLLGSDQFSGRLDTFKMYCTKVYEKVTHSYFLNYLAYSVAEMEMLGPVRKNQAAHDLYVYETYLRKRPVLYHHDKYMTFVQKFYGNVFQQISPSLEKSLYQALNHYASPARLHAVLSKDELLRDRRIRELVMMLSLKGAYYEREVLSEQVLVILDSLTRYSEYNEHRLIAKNILEHLQWLAVGTQAPDFFARTLRDSVWKLSENSQRYIYIGFWSVHNTHSLNDMKLLNQIHKKYASDIDVVMINVDDDPLAWKKFVDQHPEYNWTNIRTAGNTKILTDYRVASLPAYYLLSPGGRVYQSPALAPVAPGGAKSIDNVFHDIYNRLHPRGQRHMPGDRD